MRLQISHSVRRLLRVHHAAVTCALLSIAAAATASAKIAFRGPSSLFATGSTPTSVAIADLDRDGKADLVVTNSAVYSESRISSISILKGRGDGTFEPQHVIPVGNVPQAVVIVDLNGDGLLDLAVANYGELSGFAASISVLLGNGDGTFGPVTDYPAGDKVRSLRAADLNGDGHPDLVTEGAVLLGNGDGTFGAARTYGGELDWYAAVGDVNGDGHPDIVTSNLYADENDEDSPYLRAYAVRLGNGDGTFQAPVRQGQGLTCWGLELADLNGDGLLDLAVCNHGGDDRGNLGGILVHLGKGDGTFGPARLFPTGLAPMSVAVADLNGDGKIDLVTANYAGDPDVRENSLTVLLGNGDGTFRRGADLQTGEGPVFVTAGRLDVNSDLDLVSVNQLSSTVSVFMGNGDGTFGFPDRPMGGRPTGLDAADFNRDNRVDLVVSRWDPPYAGPGPANVIFGNGDGTFGAPSDLPLTSGQMSVTAADLNGDRAPDLAFSGGTGVSVMMARGDGTFGPQAEASQVGYPGLLAFGDLNGDGPMDMVIPIYYGGSAVLILLGHGDGTFAPSTRYETGSLPYSAAIGDLNGDGKLDIVLGLGGYSVSVLLGRGDGSFSPHVDYASGNFFVNVAPVGLADLNEDGRLDVVNGDLVWLGNGDGTLRAGTKLDGRADQGMVLQDLDGDHHVDLASLHGEETGTVSIYPGRGDGTFGARVDYGTGAWPLGLTAGDFDGDGRPDLAVANSGSSSISILLNRSEGPVIPASFELKPAVVNPRSDARWITGVISVSAPHSTSDIDVTSIRLNGAVAADGSAPSPQGRKGARELSVRFDRTALAAVLSPGEQVPVTVTGELGHNSFAGTTTVRVLANGRSPVSDEYQSTAHPTLGLHMASPARADGGTLRLGITLEEDGPARLDLLDVAGRVVGTRSLKSLTAGPHDVELASAGSLLPGVYFLRLRQGAREVSTKAAIVR